MKNFNQSFLLDFGNFNFDFARIKTPNGDKFFVQAVNSEGRITSFEMKDRGEKNFTIVQPAPDWVIGIQHSLNNVINNHPA